MTEPGPGLSKSIIPAESARAAFDAPSPIVVTESSYEDGTTKTVVGSPSGRSTSSAENDAQTQHFEGRPTQKEGNVPDALHRLADKLNELAGSRVWRERAGPGMILVLDTNDAPAYTDGPLPAEIARAAPNHPRHFGRWAQVWLVGPTVARTIRLEGDSHRDRRGARSDRPEKAVCICETMELPA